MRSLELLSPARDAATGRIAILAGADAVYIGAPAFGARASASNSIADIAGLASFAHLFRARVYVTMNTILFDDEIEEARKIVWQLYAAGVDALIVQDMAYLNMDMPPIALHASTQCDIRTPEKAARLANAGFSQLVLPREFSAEQIAECRKAAGVPVEVFVHGALCVSYSGDCQAGYAAMGRSANRGVCPQMCRLPYRLTDADGKDLAPVRHYLSLKDLNQCGKLRTLIDAGATSFKIEGRLKDARYVANVTAAYSKAIDDIISSSGGEYVRASAGICSYAFTPDLNRTFNRGYTNYFISPLKPEKIASLDTPKWIGLPVGTVTSHDSSRGVITADLTTTLSNGDGLGFFDKNRQYTGFRLNRIEGKRLYPATPIQSITPGTKIYRNNDKAFFDILDRHDAGCNRHIPVSFTLENIDDGHFSVTANDTRGCSATIVCEAPYTKANNDQMQARRNIFAKLGDTIYCLDKIDDRLGERFIAASVLSAARRQAIAMLDIAALATYVFDKRNPDSLEKDAFATVPPLSYHDNVANSLSRKFYTDHGATIAAMALETAPAPKKDTQVMSTRYCIRRELGACLRKKDEASKLPSPLFLRDQSNTYRLDFDCGRCGMTVTKCRQTQ